MAEYNSKTTHPWLALIGISIVSFLGCLDLTIVDTALPSIQSALTGALVQLQWVVNGFMLALAAFMVVMGKLADSYGRRRILYLGMAGFALFSLGAGLAPNIQWLIVFRILQGVTVAITYTVPVAIIPTLFSAHIQGRMMGILVAVSGFGLAIGPVIGGFIISLLSWRWIFLVNPIFVMVAFALCMRYLPESRSPCQTKLDWFGAILLMLALPAAIFATVNASHWGWLSSYTLSLYGVAAVLLYGFYRHEKKHTSPIVDFNLLKNNLFIVGVLANFGLAFFYNLAFFLMPLYLHYIKQINSYQIGLSLLAGTLMVAILSPWVGHFVDKNGSKGILKIGFILLVASAIMQIFFQTDTSWLYIETAFILLGIGWAFILNPSIVTAVAMMPKEDSGVAMGTLGTVHNFGGTVGLAIGTVVYHYFSLQTLMGAVDQKSMLVMTWMQEATANPDLAIGLIQKNTSLSITNARTLFENYFIHGYAASMGLLAVVAVITLGIVVGLDKRNASRSES